MLSKAHLTSHSGMSGSRCIIENINSASKRASGLSGEARKSEIFASDYSAVAELMKDISLSDGSERDTDSEKLLTGELSALGFEFSGLSVWGRRSRRVYMRGVDIARAGVGEEDIKKRAEEILCARLSSPEFSIDGKYISAVEDQRRYTLYQGQPYLELLSGSFSYCLVS